MKLWDVSKQTHVCDYRDHGKHVTSLDVNAADECTLLSSSYDGIAKLWDSREATSHWQSPREHAATGHRATLCGHKTEITCVRWFPSYDYTFATGGDDGCVRLWDLRTRKPLMEYEVLVDAHSTSADAQVYCIEFLRSGRAFFVGLCFCVFCFFFIWGVGCLYDLVLFVCF